MNLYRHIRMFWSLLFSACVFGDIIREDNFFKGEFSNNHKGRMLRVLMVFNNLPLDKCAVKCIQHIRCKTVNYNFKKEKCELTDVDFNDEEADKLSFDWYNYGTQPKVNGKWGPWRNVTLCTATCNGGTMNQVRDCDSPEPDHGGDFCVGKGERTVGCYTQPCPVNGNWGAWKNDMACSALCGGGQLNQTRRCDSPEPQHGGKDCVGERQQIIKCNNHPCSDTNVALNKRATQSSSVRGFEASKGNDGNPGTFSIAANQYTTTYPWWEVDLGVDMKIDYIVFCGQPMMENKHVYIEATSHASSTYWKSDDLLLSKGHLMFNFHSKLKKMRYIKITLKDVGPLFVSEFEVYVKKS